MEKNKTSIASATKWSIYAEVIAKLISPVTTMVLARVINLESFGILASITMIISLTDDLINNGFQKTLIQISKKSEKYIMKCNNVCFWCNFFLSLIFWIIIIIFRRYITVFIGIQGKEIEIIVAGMILPISSFSTIQEGIYIKKLDYKILFFNRCLIVVIPLFITIPIAFITKNYWALIIGNICMVLAKSTYLTLKSEWKPSFNFDFSILYEIYFLVIINILDALIYWLTSWLDIFFINKIFGIYYGGLYKTSQTLVSSITSLITAGITSVVFSSLAYHRNDYKKFVELFYFFQKGLSILVIPLGIGMYLYKETIVLLLLGNKWILASNMVGVWGVVISIISVYGTLSREAYRAVGESKISFYIQLLHLLFIIPILIWASKMEYNKFILIRSLAFLQIIFLHSIFMKKLFNISFFKMLKNTYYPIVCSVIMGTIAIFLKRLYTTTWTQIISIFICIIIYFICILVNKKYRILIFSFMIQYKKKEFL